MRIASRLQKSPLTDDPDKPGHFLLRPKEVDEDGVQIEHSDEDFHPTEVQDLWPPNDAPRVLFDIISSGDRVGQVDAMADDTALVYMTGPSSVNPNGERAVVLISFDKNWRHDSLKRISLGSCQSNVLGMSVDTDNQQETDVEASLSD